MIAGKAAGIYDDLAEVAFEHASAAGSPFEPDLEKHYRYEVHIKRYIEMQKTLTETFKSQN